MQAIVVYARLGAQPEKQNFSVGKSVSRECVFVTMCVTGNGLMGFLAVDDSFSEESAKI